MAEDRNFEPYIDWEDISDEMTSDFREKFLEYKKAQEMFTAHSSNENAARFLRIQFELSRLSAAIAQTLYTVPMMVHVAGPKVSGKDDDGEEQIVQRCKRCGSILQSWQPSMHFPTSEGPLQIPEDSMMWWEEDAGVAKSVRQGTMYPIEGGRELEKHEKICPDLTSLAV